MKVDKIETKWVSNKYQSIERKSISEKKRKSPESPLLINQPILQILLTKNQSQKKKWEEKKKKPKKNFKRNKLKLKKDKKEWILKNNEQNSYKFHLNYNYLFLLNFFFFQMNKYSKIKRNDHIFLNSLITFVLRVRLKVK